MPPEQQDWMRSSLEPMILKLLSRGPSYGYLIQKTLQEASPHWDIQIGTLYRSLRRLEAGRFIKCKWDRSTVPARKWYVLTPAGQRKLEHQSNQWLQHAELIMRLFRPEQAEPATDMPSSL